MVASPGMDGYKAKRAVVLDAQNVGSPCTPAGQSWKGYPTLEPQDQGFPIGGAHSLPNLPLSRLHRSPSALSVEGLLRDIDAAVLLNEVDAAVFGDSEMSNSQTQTSDWECQIHSMDGAAVSALSEAIMIPVPKAAKNRREALKREYRNNANFPSGVKEHKKPSGRGIWKQTGGKTGYRNISPKKATSLRSKPAPSILFNAAKPLLWAEEVFEQYYRRLVKFKTDFGHTFVGADYDVTLHRWCNIVRQAGSMRTLNPRNREQLDGIGFNWRQVEADRASAFSKAVRTVKAGIWKGDLSEVGKAWCRTMRECLVNETPLANYRDAQLRSWPDFLQLDIRNFPSLRDLEEFSSRAHILGYKREELLPEELFSELAYRPHGGNEPVSQSVYSHEVDISKDVGYFDSASEGPSLLKSGYFESDIEDFSCEFGVTEDPLKGPDGLLPQWLVSPIQTVGPLT